MNYSRASKWLLAAFHPLIFPLIGISIFLFGNSTMAALKPSAKWFLEGVVAANTLLIPLLLLMTLHFLQILPGPKDGKKWRRIIPIGVVALCYLGCLFMLRDITVAFLLRRLVLAALCCAVIATGSPFFTNVSAHMMAVGALIAALAMGHISGIGSFMPWILSFTVLAGIMASARLYMGYNSLWQIALWFVAGGLITVTLMLI